MPSNIVAYSVYKDLSKKHAVLRVALTTYLGELKYVTCKWPARHSFPSKAQVEHAIDSKRLALRDQLDGTYV